MNIISVIPNNFGAVITAKGDSDELSTSFHYSNYHKNIHDPKKEGYWIGNGWDTLTEAIEYIIGLNNNRFKSGYQKALLDVTRKEQPSLPLQQAIAYSKTWGNIIKD